MRIVKVKIIPVTTGTNGTISESQTVPEQHYWRVWNQVTTENSHIGHCTLLRKVKVKAVPLRSWSSPEGSRKLRFPDFMTTAQVGGKVVSPTHRPPLPSENTPLLLKVLM